MRVIKSYDNSMQLVACEPHLHNSGWCSVTV